MIYDIPGFPAILAKDLVENLVEQGSYWSPALVLGEQAKSISREPIPNGEPEEQCWVIETNQSKNYTRTVVITAGIGAFRPVKLKNESLERLEGKGVDYLVRDLNQYKDRRVLVIGGGDSAVDWALALEPIAEQVTLIHRRPGFRAHDSSVNALMESNVDVRIYYELRELKGTAKVEEAVIFDNRTQEDLTIDVDAIIPSLGFKADLGPIREWGLETIGRRYIKVNHKMETNLLGVYAAGDVALQEDLDPLNLIVVGFGQVTVAVNYAYTQIKPGGKVFPGHSSEKMAKKAS
jgi:thioredoxin reductase (NADPH)